MRRPSRCSVVNLPSCEQCETALSEWVETETIDSLDREELDKLKLRIQRYEGLSGVRHTVVRIEGMYSYSKTDPVEHCSYSKHRHRKGVVVETACTQLLQLGMKCGSRCVDDFANVVNAVRVQERVTREQDLDAEVEALRDRLEVLVDWLRRRGRVLSLLLRELPAFHRAMTIACEQRQSEVIVPGWKNDPLTGQKVPDDKRFVLKGLTLFHGVDTARAEASLRRAYALIERRRTVSYGRSTINELSKERKALYDEVKRIEAFVRETDGFWTNENLTVALYRTYGVDAPKNIAVSQGTIIVSGERTWVFGFDSVKRLEPSQSS